MYIHSLQKTLLFKDVQDDQIEQLLMHLKAFQKTYKKNETIIRKGENIETVGIILKGEVHVMQSDYWGNTNILMDLQENEIFAEAYACIDDQDMGVSVEASQDCEILFIHVKSILNPCPYSCSSHKILFRNLLNTIARKNIFLNDKISLMSKKTIREKVLSYLSNEALRNNSKIFKIPYNRQELADFLGVDRSALSHELSKMQNEGILSFHKNSFQLEQKET